MAMHQRVDGCDRVRSVQPASQIERGTVSGRRRKPGDRGHVGGGQRRADDPQMRIPEPSVLRHRNLDAAVVQGSLVDSHEICGADATDGDRSSAFACVNKRRLAPESTVERRRRRHVDIGHQAPPATAVKLGDRQ
jgi:hypothetical protein